MAKKVYELANEIGVGAIDLVEKLKTMCFNVRNHMASLTDEEVAKAKAAYETPSKSSAPVKKAVVRKVVRKEAPVEEAPVAKEAPEEEAPVTAKVAAPEVATTAPAEAPATEDKPKVVTVKRKTKAQKEEEVKHAAEAKEEAAAQAAAEQAARDAAPDNSPGPGLTAKARDPKKDYFEEKRHTFTPIFTPDPKKKEESTPEKRTSSPGLRIMQPAPKPINEEDMTEEEKDKKRMGDLAAAVGKKAVGAGKKDLTVIRADEELKYASALVGKAIYTPAKKKKIYSGPTQKTLITEVKDSKRVITLHGGATVGDLAQKLSVRFEQLQNKMLQMNLLVRLLVNGFGIARLIHSDLLFVWNARQRLKSENIMTTIHGNALK
jgi:translation initiation factor IF-2